MLRARAMTIATLLLTAVDALAAQAPPASGSSAAEIIVTGQRPDQSKRERAAVTAIARTVPQGGFDAQFGRWEEAVCVGVIGLPVQPAQFIADRIGVEARAVKIGAQGPGCHPNIYIVATSEPVTLIHKARGSKSGLLSGIANSDIVSIERSHAAVRWAALTGMTGTAGEKQGDDLQGTGTPSNNTLKVWHASHIKASTRAVLQRMVVIVDLSQVDGQNLGQLAAYLTMVSLAQLRPNADAPMVNTVLAAFRHDGSAPDDLTDFDRAYLKALYAMPADEYGPLQKQAIVGGINRTLKAPLSP